MQSLKAADVIFCLISLSPFRHSAICQSAAGDADSDCRLPKLPIADCRRQSSERPAASGNNLCVCVLFWRAGRWSRRHFSWPVARVQSRSRRACKTHRRDHNDTSWHEASFIVRIGGPAPTGTWQRKCADANCMRAGRRLRCRSCCCLLFVVGRVLWQLFCCKS